MVLEEEGIGPLSFFWTKILPSEILTEFLRCCRNSGVLPNYNAAAEIAEFFETSTLRDFYLDFFHESSNDSVGVIAKSFVRSLPPCGHPNLSQTLQGFAKSIKLYRIKGTKIFSRFSFWQIDHAEALKAKSLLALSRIAEPFKLLNAIAEQFLLLHVLRSKFCSYTHCGALLALKRILRSWLERKEVFL